MWTKIADIILRYRIGLLAGIVAATALLGVLGIPHVEMSQEFLKVVPPDDADMQRYEAFRKRFGADDNVVIIVLESKDWFQPARLDALWRLTKEIQGLEGVTRVLNVTNAPDLRFDPDGERFVSAPQITAAPKTDSAAAALKSWVTDRPFYRNVLFDSSQTALVTAVSIRQEFLETKGKHALMRKIRALVEAFCAEQQTVSHLAGVPHLRTYMARKLPRELALFMGLSVLLTAIALYGFYRSLYAVIFPLVLLVLSSVVTLSLFGLLDYKLTMLTAMLPPIIIILGIPPSIYMLSDYHEEYKRTGDKIEALRLMVRKLGLVTLMINANTAFGFLTLYLTSVVLLQQFGLIAFLGTMLSYVITIILIPGVFSLLPPPSEKKLRHLDAPYVNRFLDRMDGWVRSHRRLIYGVSAGLVVVSVFGMAQLRAVSFMVDDLPRHDDIYADLRFIEDRFGGAMPFELALDFGKAGAVRKTRNLRKMEQLQQWLETHPEISRTLSVVDVMKWTRQAMLGGGAETYALPAKEELDFIGRYAQRSHLKLGGQGGGLTMLVDSTNRYARITGYVRDIGSVRLPVLTREIEHEIDSLFNKPKRTVDFTVTGTTRIFLKANEYLIDNLAWSLLATFLIIGLQMLLLFGSWRIMVISLIPNLIPLLVTAGVMGFMGMTLKPSTALIYELAFGIAIDNSIHYLASYRYYRRHGLNRDDGVRAALRNTGLGIGYTSFVLLCGFAIFVLSAFGSTQALGLLTSVTLLIALFTNLLLMPALVLHFDNDTSFYRRKALIDEDDDAAVNG